MAFGAIAPEGRGGALIGRSRGAFSSGITAGGAFGLVVVTCTRLVPPRCYKVGSVGVVSTSLGTLRVGGSRTRAATRIAGGDLMGPISPIR